MKNMIGRYDAAAYEQYICECFDEFKPQGSTEEMLVRTLADTAWRMRLMLPAETDILTPSATDSATLGKQIRLLNALSLHSERLSRLYDSTLKLIQMIQAERRPASRKRISLKRVDKQKFTTDGTTIQ